MDDDCEGEILRIVLGLCEGRGRGDEVFDQLAATLLPIGSGIASQIIFLNLSDHYEDYAVGQKQVLVICPI